MGILGNIGLSRVGFPCQNGGIMENYLLVAGVVVLGMALRSIHSPILSRLGLLCYPLAAYLLGYFVLGTVWWGVLLTVTVILVPIVRVVINAFSVCVQSNLELISCPPPPPIDFPDLENITEQIEKAGFEYVSDIGSIPESGFRIFYRTFLDSSARVQANICLIEQENISFFYVTFCSRLSGGRRVLTWNYPFPYELEFSPQTLVKRTTNESVPEQLNLHKKILEDNAQDGVASIGRTSLAGDISDAFSEQIHYNLSAGILKRIAGDDGNMRYTLRGFFFLVRQFIKSFIPNRL